MAQADLVISPVSGKTDLKAFVDFAWEVYGQDPNWVPPLKNEVLGMLTPGKNPFFGHAEANISLPAGMAGSRAASPRISTGWRWPSRQARAWGRARASGACSMRWMGERGCANHGGGGLA